MFCEQRKRNISILGKENFVTSCPETVFKGFEKISVVVDDQ
jgi:hypothetical protein